MTILICLLALATVAGSFLYTLHAVAPLDPRATALTGPVGLRNAAA